MGDRKMTARNLEIVRVDAENRYFLVKGAVPGAIGAGLVIRKTKKGVRVPKVSKG
jgi:large subunit ribosomal protein L3